MAPRRPRLPFLKPPRKKKLAMKRNNGRVNNAKASVGLLVHFAVGILVHLRYQLDGGLIGQVQHLVLSRGLLHPAVDLGKGMDIGRPLGALADEEAQLIVVGPSPVIDTEDLVETGDVKSLHAIIGLGALVEILPQFGSDNLVGIDHQHPSLDALWMAKVRAGSALTQSPLG